MYIYSVKIYSNCTSTTTGEYGTLVAEYLPSGTGFKETLSGKQYNAIGSVEAAPENANLINQVYVGVGGAAKQVIKGYVGVNGEAKLFYFRFIEKTFTSSIFPRSWSGNTGTNSYGTWRASGGNSYDSAHIASKAFDGSDSTSWRGASGTITNVTISCPTNVFIKPTRMYCHTAGQASSDSTIVSGYLNSESTRLYSSGYTGALNESFSVNTTEFFDSFSVYAHELRTVYPYVYELDVTRGVVRYNG